LGEDFAFCKLWKDIGGKCYALINQADTARWRTLLCRQI
jgi:hypothetical protein